jgi:hypothetical protein
MIGAALAANWPTDTVFYMMAVPMVVAGLVVLLLGRRNRKRQPQVGLECAYRGATVPHQSDVIR